MKNLNKHKKVRDVNLTKEDLINFETDIVKHWENGEITAPIHLSNGNEEQVIEYCRDNLARFKVPKNVVFVELPKTSTGKVQKFVLRELAEAL